MTVLDTFENSGLYARPYKKWLKHLESKYNTRILFSGRFGSGKTTFLAHYFHLNDDTRPKEAKYNAFSISPVHYSVSSNEDIIKYIKCDILINFLKQNVTFSNADVSYLENIVPFAKKNVTLLIPLILRMIPQVGKELKDVYTELEKLAKKFSDFAKKQSKKEDDILSGYMTKLKNQEGSLFEDDIIVTLIQKKLASLKEESGKENILIIDDLDRLDPDHVFRILNVFSAHIHAWEASENKFGFDKVIIVCDVENIRNIFKAKFGGQTDFNGYIDKFYSTEIFSFVNTEMIRETLAKAIDNISFAPISRTWDNYSKEIEADKRILIDLCNLLVESRRISLRTLITKLRETIQIITNESLSINNYFNIHSYKHPTIFQLQILKNIIGDYDYLVELLETIPARNFVILNKNYYANIFLFILNHETTFYTKGRAQIEFNGKILYSELSSSFEKDIKELRFSTYENGMPTQYAYTKKDIKELLISFILLLKHSEV